LINGGDEVTEEAVKAATGNKRRGEKALALLLKKREARSLKRWPRQQQEIGRSAETVLSILEKSQGGYIVAAFTQLQSISIFLRIYKSYIRSISNQSASIRN
jgi:ribosomal protein S1